MTIALFNDSINSFNVTFLNRGIGLRGINSGISSLNSILSKAIFDPVSFFPNKISSILFTYLFNNISDLILSNNAAAKRTLLEMKKLVSSICLIFSKNLSVRSTMFMSQGSNCSVLIKS